MKSKFEKNYTDKGYLEPVPMGDFLYISMR
jgi:hypothetical protein